MSSPGAAAFDEKLLVQVAAGFGLRDARPVAALGGTASPKWRVDTARGRFVIRRRHAGVGVVAQLHVQRGVAGRVDQRG